MPIDATLPPTGAPDWLIGPSEGWSLEPVVRWMLGEGRGLREMAFVVGLVEQLDAAGAHVDRFRVGSSILHPLIVAMGVVWSRDEGARIWRREHGVPLSAAHAGSPIQLAREQNRTVRCPIDRPMTDEDHTLLREAQAAGMTELLVLPVRFSSGSINLMTVETRRSGGFTDADVARFEALARLLAPHGELMSTRRTMLGLMETFVGHRLVERIVQGQVKRGDSEAIEAAFWYSDLRGFTALSELLPADEVLELLNTYFEHCAAAAAARGGEIIQFIGDAILIVFDIPTPADEARVCADALDAGLDAFAQLAVVNLRRRRAGKPTIEFGLGLHLGRVVHANVGAPDRLAFNVVGPAVNMTARIQEMTKQTHEALLVSAEFARHIRSPLRSVGTFDLRGIAKTTELFAPVPD